MEKFLLFVFITVATVVNCLPLDTIDEELRPESQIIDMTNLKKNELEEFQKLNINATALRLMQMQLRSNHTVTNAPSAMKQMPFRQQASAPVPFSDVKNFAMDKIKMNLESSLLRSNQSKPSGASHELALPANCELPKNTNETFWKTGPAWNLYFPVVNKAFSSVKAATLRIFKLGNGNQTHEKCKDKDEDLITVTAYVYWKKRAERRRRTLSIMTVSKSYQGWIAFDVLMAVRYWDKPHKNLGLSIEVRDQDDVPVPAESMFKPVDCNETIQSFHGTSFESRYTGPQMKWTLCPTNQE